MRIGKLHLRAFGPFTDRLLDFGTDPGRLILVQGANEAGKSSALRAISDLRFGIPTQSRDDFIHSHPNMRIGGEFFDRNGKAYSLIRRKGRTGTLHFTEFAGPNPAPDQPASPEIEILLNCGLTKEQHDSMFGIDHQTLREGGEALLKGEGEVGAALFEASAGGPSVPEILARLEGSARKYFMPGARARNAKINEALIAYEQHQATFRQAQVRPAVWTDLSKKQTAAAKELSALERRNQDIHGRLLLIRELRSVAPLMATLETATAMLKELDETPLLDINATTERVASEKGLADALYNAQTAAVELERYSNILNQPSVDARILEIAPAVRRLVSAAETIDEHQRDIAQVRTELALLTQDLTRLASSIMPTMDAHDVVAKIPAHVQRAAIEQNLRSAEHAHHALKQHQATAFRPAVLQDTSMPAPPSPEVTSALHIAQNQVTRSDADLTRLALLPTEIKATQRAVHRALLAISVPDESAFERLRPLLDAQIDAALKQENEHQTRRTAFGSRLQAVNQAIQATVEQHDRLLGRGEVATWNDVIGARAMREVEWKRVRDAYIDRTEPFVDGPSDGGSAPRIYEEAVQEADRIVDAFASDTKRAADLQATKDKLSGLERDRDEINRQLSASDRENADQTQAWESLLAAAGLPLLPPAALRDWQALVPIARTAIENRRTKADEFERIQQIEKSLSEQLRGAILGTGLAAPGEEATLSVLIAMAHEIDLGFKQQETSRATAAGKEAARATQAREWSTRNAELTSQSEAANATLQTSLQELLLPQSATEVVVRARLAEFDRVRDVFEQIAVAQRRQARSEQLVEQIMASAKVIWEHLEDSVPTDLRIYSDQLAERLDAADAAKSARSLAEQAKSNASESLQNHEALAQRYQDTISALCRAAAVDSATALPAAEDASRRKREAQDAIDRTRAQLAQASKRPIDELRSLLRDPDPVRMDAEETSLIYEQQTLNTALAAAREADERARRDLDAIDSSDTAVVAREAMERAASGVRASMALWIRSKIAHSLLAEALKRFRDRAQGPMLIAASAYFSRMTRDRFVRLVSDDSGKEVVLVALRSDGARIHVQEMSEGTRDQLYLALRLAALDFRRKTGVDLPIILDDILITSDNDRSAAILEALSDAACSHQVIVLTHHQHIVDIAMQTLPAERLRVAML